MTSEEINIIMEFLGRTTLKPQEIQAFNHVCKVIQESVDEDPKPRDAPKPKSSGIDGAWD